MNDLYERANKHARGAGRIQSGHYHVARSNDRLHRAVNLLSVVLGAIVGASIFTSAVEAYPWQTGVLALLAAALTALQASSGFADRAERHRTAGADYGQIRRDADMLKLKLRGEDIRRAAAIAELERIGARMTDLAKQNYALSDRIFSKAKEHFDNSHPEYELSNTAP